MFNCQLRDINCRGCRVHVRRHSFYIVFKNIDTSLILSRTPRLDAPARALKILEANGIETKFHLAASQQKWLSPRILYPEVKFKRNIGGRKHAWSMLGKLFSGWLAEVGCCDNDASVQKGLLRDPFFSGKCVFQDAARPEMSRICFPIYCALVLHNLISPVHVN